MDDKQGQSMEIRNQIMSHYWTCLRAKRASVIRLARKIELFSRFNLKKFEFSRLNYCLLVAKYHKSLL